MNTKKKPLYTLLSLLIVLALAVPVLSLAATADPGDFAGGSGTPGDPYQIADWHHLDNVRNHLDSDFILMNDLNAATAGYELLAGLAADGGKGWEPIGVLGVSFTGSFDGQVYEIRDLFIDRDDEDGVGVFGSVDDGGVIQNVGVVSVNVTGSDGVGGLVGDNWGGTVINSYATGSVIGDYSVGGLVGWNAGTVNNCYSSASVTGNDAVGGLVGSSDGVVDYSYSNCIVTGDSFVGGLVGDNFEGLVGNAYSGSTVTGRSDVGGLVGINDGVVSNCYATGDVIGDEYVGGLIGSNRLVSVNDAASGGSIAGNHDSGGQARGRSITIVNSYSDAATSGNPDLVGVMEEGGGDVSNCYAAGSVSGNSNAGGLVGLNEAVVSNSFWDTETSGQAGSAGGTGKATAEMKDITTFTDITTAGLDEAWDMTSVVSGARDPVYTWNIVDGATYPFLSREPSGQIRDWYDLNAARGNLSGDYTLMNNLDAATAGYEELAGPTANEGEGWQPIGTSASPFAGTFHGQGYEIRDLVINRPAESLVGLFGWVNAMGAVGAIGLASANVTGKVHVGGLVGRNDGTVASSYVVGSVNATSYVGGLIGQNFGTVTNSHFTGAVTGDPQNYGGVYVGGLIGRNNDTGTVDDCYSTGNVTGRDYVGGLVGYNWKGAVSGCHTAGSVAGDLRVGGLVGQNEGEGTVSNSFSTANVSGTDMVGGLTGSNMGTVSNSYSVGSAAGTDRVGGLSGDNGGTLSSSYATGNVTGSLSVGGLVGQNGGIVSRCYATGSIGGNNHVGGLLGWNWGGNVTDSYSTGSTTHVSGSATTLGGFVGRNDQGQIINCYSTGSVHYQELNPDPTDKGFAGSVDTGGGYQMTGNFWDMETSGQTSTAGEATGKTTVQMQDIATFSDAGWHITAVASGETDDGYIWNIINGRTYPFLSWQDPVEAPGALILGQTREVNCAILPGVTVVLYDEHAVEVDSMISDGDGNYTLAVPDLGEYTVVASMAGFRDRERSVSVTELTAYTVDFVADHGLIPDAPNMSYVLACINLWQYGEPHCKLTMSTVLAVINAWQVPAV